MAEVQTIDVDDKLHQILEKRMKDYNIEPFPESGIVTYIPVSSSYSRTDLQQNRVRYAPNIQLKHKLKEYNPATKRTEPIAFVSSYTFEMDAQGNPYLKPEMPQIFMQNGKIILGKGDLALYVFLECSSENLSNPNRDVKVSPKFRKLDFGKQKAQSFRVIERRAKAESIAMSMGITEIEDHCKLFYPDIDVTQKSEELKRDFVLKVSANPEEFISKIDPSLLKEAPKAEESKPTESKQSLADIAIEKGLIVFQGISWFWSKEYHEGKEIITSEMGVAAKETLNNYIESGNAKAKVLVKQINELI